MSRKKNKKLLAFSSLIKGKINPSLLIILSDDKCKKHRIIREVSSDCKIQPKINVAIRKDKNEGKRNDAIK